MQPQAIYPWLGAHSSSDYLEMASRKGLRSYMRRMYRNYIRGEHLDLLIRELEKVEDNPGSRLIVTMPPRHSKSRHVSEGFPAWYLGRNPSHRIILGAHTARLSEIFSRRIRAQLLHERWPFPNVELASDLRNLQAWDTNHDGGLIAVGVGGSPTGHGANLMILDDPIRNFETAESALQREDLEEWYTGTMRTRLQPGGSIIICATRWHDDDLSGKRLKEAEEGGEPWREIHFPAISEEGKALWPEMWPLEELEKTRAAVRTKVWSSQYQGKPEAAEGGLLKRTWWKRYKELPTIEKAEIYLDSAFKTGVSNDYSAFALWARSTDGHPYLIWVWKKKVEFPDLLKMAHIVYNQSAERVGTDTVKLALVIEDKASGQSAIQTLRHPIYQADGDELPRLPVIAYKIDSGLTKVNRVEGVSGLVEGGSVYIPESAPWLDDWLYEHERFPNLAHDDQVDTTVMALMRLGKPRKKVDIR